MSNDEILYEDLLLTQAFRKTKAFVKQRKYALLCAGVFITMIGICIWSWTIFLNLATEKDVTYEQMEDTAIVCALVGLPNTVIELILFLVPMAIGKSSDHDDLDLRRQLAICITGNKNTNAPLTAFCVMYVTLITKMISCTIYIWIARSSLTPLSQIEYAIALYLLLLVEYAIAAIAIVCVIIAAIVYYTGIGIAKMCKHCCILPFHAFRNERARRRKPPTPNI